MTKPLDLQGRFRNVSSPHESSLERLARRCAWGVILCFAIVILMMVYRTATSPPPATIREITPAERKQIAFLEDKFRLHGYMWLLDRRAGEISYWRKGKWQVIKI